MKRFVGALLHRRTTSLAFFRRIATSVLMPALIPVLVWALFASPPAAASDDSVADEDQIMLEGDHGGGYVHRPGGYIPIYAELSNNSTRDYVVRLEADWDGLQGRVMRKIDLPAGSFKEINMVVGPVSYAGEYELRAVDDETDGLLEDLFMTSVVVAKNRPLIGLLDPHPMGWGGLQDREDFDGKIVHLDTKFLPAWGEALDSFDIIVWPDPRPGVLRDDQAEALAHWTKLGGTLVLAADRSGASDLRRFTSLLPGPVRAADRLDRLTEFTGVDLEPFSPPLAVTPILRADGGSSAAEIYDVERRGRGRVAVLGFDPRAIQLAGWPGLPQLWGDLLDQTRRLTAETGQKYGGWNFDLRTQSREYLTRGIGGLPLPLSALGFLLVLYLIVIGPGEYFLLRRLDRLKWTWITFPIWVFLFTGLAWGIAAVSRTGEPILRQIVLRDAVPDSEVFSEEIHTALFVLRAGDYRLDLPTTRSLPLVRSGEREQFFGWGRQARAFSQTWQSGPTAVSARIPKWSFLTGAFLRHAPLEGAEVRIVGDSLLPRIGVSLRDAVLLDAQGGIPRITRLGDLRDAEQHALEEPELLVENPENFTPDLFEEDLDLEQFVDDLTLTTARQLILRQGKDADNYEFNRFHDDPHPAHDWSNFLDAGGKVLIGWAPDETPRVEVDGLDREVKTSGIVVYRFAVDGRIHRE